jgi:hypothetical protein
MSRLLALACAFAGVTATTEAQAAPLAPHLPIVVSIHSHVEAKLAAIADRIAVRAPDVRVLTTEPVAPEHMKGASSGFGWRDDPIRHVRKFHGGDDYRGDRGRPIRAAGDGTVILAQRQGGYGNVIYVDHGGGLVTRYGHLSRIGVKKGELVVAGQTIGKLGSTGRTTGPHLHFEVRIDGSPVDPSKAMSIAELQREDPIAGRIAAFALSPELQAKAESRFDPPKRRKAEQSKESRPDRPSRVRQPRPVS